MHKIPYECPDPHAGEASNSFQYDSSQGIVITNDLSLTMMKKNSCDIFFFFYILLVGSFLIARIILLKRALMKIYL